MIGLSHLALSSPLSYLLAFLFPALDAVFPLVPSETLIITLGVATAGSTDPRIIVLVLLAAAGAFAGDNLAYLIGRQFGPAAERRFFRGEKGQRTLAWARNSLDRYGARLIIVCRFIPGGRTAVTLTCGAVGYRHRTFMLATALAGVIWAGYAYLLGRLGGAAFEDRPWLGLLIAFGAAVLLSALIEAGRRLAGRRRARLAAAGDGPQSPPARHADRTGDAPPPRVVK